MMDVTDRHCRYFHRLLAPNSRLYTEMITANAVLKGDRARLLGFDSKESPVALQLGGSDPKSLAEASRVGSEMGYEEINLNCGCPSKRVVSGNFGASLMEHPNLVADCVNAMVNSSNKLVTVKHRLAINENNNYDFTHKFVEIVASAGCNVFIVHARNALLDGLSPKKNRTVPPLKMHFVHRLKKDFPDSKFIANGGLSTVDACLNLLSSRANTKYKKPVDGVMLGREAIHNPWILVQLEDALFLANTTLPTTPDRVVEHLQKYFELQVKIGVKPRQITKNWVYLFKNFSGSKKWRYGLTCGLSPLEAYKKANFTPSFN
jgi:tRNA-dihydrouridine synthase A